MKLVRLSILFGLGLLVAHSTPAQEVLVRIDSLPDTIDQAKADKYFGAVEAGI